MSLRNAVSLYAYQHRYIFPESEYDLNSIWQLNVFWIQWHFYCFFMLSIIGKSSPWQSIFRKSRTQDRKKVTEGGNLSYFSTVNVELAVCIRLESWDLALGTVPVASISRVWRGVSQWLVNPQAAAASGLSWQPQGYGHRFWTLAHTAWLLCLWLIPYHQLTPALCQCFFQFRKHGK